MSSAPDKNCLAGFTGNAKGDLKVIIFDFDGTLVQSNLIKSQAWYDLFSGDDTRLKVVRSVLESHGEASRYVIIRMVLERFCGKEIGQGQLTELINHFALQYNSLVLEGVKTCPEMPGASEVLQWLFAKTPLYCSSHTPETELQGMLQFRGWSQYFKDIYGYPRVKKETVAHIIATERTPPEKVLVVGDGVSDREAAESSGARFLPISSDSDLRALCQLYCC